MTKAIKKLKQYNLTFLFLNLYIILSIFTPKNYSNLFGLPIRLFITILLIIFALYDIKNKNVEINKNSVKGIIILLLIFILSTIPSLFVTKSLVISLYTIVKFISFFLLFIILYKIKFNKKEYKILIENFIICVFILSIIGTIEYAFGIDLMIKNSGINYYPGAKGRLITTFFNTIYYGIFINLVFGFIFYLINKFQNKKIVVFLIILSGLLYLNLIFTFTRSVILIFIVTLLILIFFLRKIVLNYKTLIVVLLIVLISIITPGAKTLISKSFKDAYIMTSKIATFLPIIEENDKFDYLDYNENSKFIDYSLQHREAFAKIAKKISTDNSLTGVGFGTYIEYMNSEEFDLKYPEYTLSKTHPHSCLILMSAEIGIIGTVSFIILILFLAFKSITLIIQSYKKNQVLYQISSIGFCICIGFLTVNLMSENALYDTQICYLFMTIYGLLLGYCCSINNKNTVLFISSTGGHLSELLQLKPLIEKYDSYIITEKAKSNLDLKKKYKKVYYLVYGTKDHLLSYSYKFLYNCFKSFLLYLRIRPKVIITTGTHTAVPICYIGKIFGTKVIFIETFANSKTKTLSGRMIYPIADTFVVQWESMLDLYPKAKYGGWIY